LNNFHEYLIQHSLKSGGTKDHFRQVKVPGTAPYWKAWFLVASFRCIDSYNYNNSSFESRAAIMYVETLKKDVIVLIIIKRHHVFNIDQYQLSDSDTWKYQSAWHHMMTFNIDQYQLSDSDTWKYVSESLSWYWSILNVIMWCHADWYFHVSESLSWYWQ
jgi:hypothetical protein